MDDQVSEPAAEWDNSAPPAPIAAPAAPAGPPLQALALHDLGDGMTQVRYLDVHGNVFHADLPATTPMLVSFQTTLQAYFTDIEGAAAQHAATHKAAA